MQRCRGAEVQRWTYAEEERRRGGEEERSRGAAEVQRVEVQKLNGVCVCVT